MDYERPTVKIAKGAVIFFIGTILVKLLSYIFRLVIARAGVEDYGLISIAIAIFGVISVVCIFGLDTGIYGLVSSYLGKKDIISAKRVIKSASLFSLSLSILFGFTLFIFSNYIALTFFHAEKLGPIFKIIALAIPFGVVRTIYQTALRSFQLVKFDTLSRIVENAAKLIFVIIFLYLGWGIFGIAWAYAIAAMINLLVAFVWFQKKVSPTIDKKIEAKLIDTELLAYSWPLLLNSISIILMGWTDTLMLGFFRTPAEVGLYNTASPTANLISMFTKSAMAIFLPVTANLYIEQKHTELKLVAKTTLRWIFLFNTFPMLLFVLFPKQILGLFFGDPYRGAATALVILSVFFLLSSLSDLPRETLLMVKKTKTIFHITLAGVVANIVLNLVLIPKYGITGAAIATGISYIITTISFFVTAYQKTKMFLLDWTYAKILAALGLVFIAVWYGKSFVDIENLWALLALMTGTMLVYTTVLFYFGCFKKEEFMMLKALLQKVKHMGRNN